MRPLSNTFKSGTAAKGTMIPKRNIRIVKDTSIVDKCIPKFNNTVGSTTLNSQLRPIVIKS